MRNMNRLVVWASFFLIPSGYVMAGELSPVNDLGHFGAERTTVQALAQDSPKLQMAEISGMISAYDDVSEKMSVSGIEGSTLDFVLDTNTPIKDHNLQIGFTDLRLGDHVTVRYNVEPRRVNAIERI